MLVVPGEIWSELVWKDFFWDKICRLSQKAIVPVNEEVEEKCFVQ